MTTMSGNGADEIIIPEIGTVQLRNYLSWSDLAEIEDKTEKIKNERIKQKILFNTIASMMISSPSISENQIADLSENSLSMILDAIVDRLEMRDLYDKFGYIKDSKARFYRAYVKHLQKFSSDIEENQVKLFPSDISTAGSQVYVISNQIQPSLNELKKSDPADVQIIVASQINIMSKYHDLVLNQAQKSFNWALVAAISGSIFLVGAIIFSLIISFQSTATISAISGILIEFIAGINFYLYGKTTNQLAVFQNRLDATQRYLLANSICESLDGDIKSSVRAKLIETISQYQQDKTEQK